MSFVRCVLPHPVYLILPQQCLLTALKNYPGLPFPESAAQVEHEFLAHLEGGLLTLVDDRQPGKLIVSFCTPRYELVCGLTPQQDAYFALRLAPLSLRGHNQIVRGAVKIIPQTWGLFEDLPALNQQVFSGGGAGPSKSGQTGIEAVLASWKQARTASAVESLPVSGTTSAELTFLANVDTLIDLACQVELEQAVRQERVSVHGVEAVALPRKSGSGYRFLLNASAGFRVGEFIRAGFGEAGVGYDGVVVEAVGGSLVLRFFQPVELKNVQRVEWLLPKISTRQYTIQHAAVSALRNNESLNPRLLPLIVENRFKDYKFTSPASPDEASSKANPAQRDLIERALIVPDLLLALGPPGTGKTATIREIVKRQAALGKKVLVTSKNNKAVDNVLEGLEDVQALRIGREEVVAPDVRLLLIDNVANDLRQKILGGIHSTQENLDGAQALWPQIQQVVDRLAQLAIDWRQAQAKLDGVRADLSTWQRNTYVRVRPLLEREKLRLNNLEAHLGQSARRADALRRRVEGLQKKCQTPVLGALFIVLADQFARDWQEVSLQYREDLQKLNRSRDSLQHIWSAYHRFVTASQQARQLKQVVAQAGDVLSAVRVGISLAQNDFARLVETLRDVPVLQEQFETPAALEAALGEWRKWIELMSIRRGLLLEWRDLLETRHQTLYPALIRRADVVGATCIGIATDMRFEDLEFDLVIADEAGQIQVMDLLVPLVRARRAVLVGDHLQLPPVVEQEIIQKIRETEPENQEIGEWLEKSLFERIIERQTTPQNNKVMLDTQYRMPRQIADFISGQFYGGNYHTGAERAHADAFFTGSPMVFVDTMREFRHFDQRAEDGQGYSNPQEASIISDLLLAYRAKSADIGVIVPYKKQADVIRRELRRRGSGLSEDELISRVATVDSFQGKEQDVIIFGFTRSNTEGHIGFLTEMRRLNVSLTRARRQLVMVGDSSTLLNAQDPDFASMVKTLLETVKKTPKGYFYANELPRHLNP